MLGTTATNTNSDDSPDASPDSRTTTGSLTGAQQQQQQPDGGGGVQTRHDRPPAPRRDEDEYRRKMDNRRPPLVLPRQQYATTTTMGGEGGKAERRRRGDATDNNSTAAVPRTPPVPRLSAKLVAQQCAAAHNRRPSGSGRQEDEIDLERSDRLTSVTPPCEPSSPSVSYLRSAIGSLLLRQTAGRGGGSATRHEEEDGRPRYLTLDALGAALPMSANPFVGYAAGTEPVSSSSGSSGSSPPPGAEGGVLATASATASFDLEEPAALQAAAWAAAWQQRQQEQQQRRAARAAPFATAPPLPQPRRRRRAESDDDDRAGPRACSAPPPPARDDPRRPTQQQQQQQQQQQAAGTKPRSSSCSSPATTKAATAVTRPHRAPSVGDEDSDDGARTATPAVPSGTDREVFELLLSCHAQAQTWYRRFSRRSRAARIRHLLASTIGIILAGAVGALGSVPMVSSSTEQPLALQAIFAVCAFVVAVVTALQRLFDWSTAMVQCQITAVRCQRLAGQLLTEMYASEHHLRECFARALAEMEAIHASDATHFLGGEPLELPLLTHCALAALDAAGPAPHVSLVVPDPVDWPPAA